MEKREIGGLNELNSSQWEEYWQLKMRNDADARKEFWRSFFVAAAIAVFVFVCLCIFAK